MAASVWTENEKICSEGGKCGGTPLETSYGGRGVQGYIGQVAGKNQWRWPRLIAIECRRESDGNYRKVLRAGKKLWEGKRATSRSRRIVYQRARWRTLKRHRGRGGGGGRHDRCCYRNQLLQKWRCVRSEIRQDGKRHLGRTCPRPGAKIGPARGVTEKWEKVVRGFPSLGLKTQYSQIEALRNC